MTLKMLSSFVLGSHESSTYPKGTPPVRVSPVASVEKHLERHVWMARNASCDVPAGSDLFQPCGGWKPAHLTDWNDARPESLATERHV